MLISPLHFNQCLQNMFQGEDLALYDNKSWNDPRDLLSPVKAIFFASDVRVHLPSPHRAQKIKSNAWMEAHLALMQPTQMNKITSSCEICGGPHDTWYCMENPEQAFVDYASSRTDGTRSR
ncbi:hypothetical protein Tco_0865542 [Tanacetum coccineum]